MNLRHSFNQHQEQFTYLFTALFVGVIAVLYLWSISIITVALSTSFAAGTLPAPPANFNFSSIKSIPFLNTSSTK
jgi:hypothetical protein